MELYHFENIIITPFHITIAHPRQSDISINASYCKKREVFCIARGSVGDVSRYCGGMGAVATDFFPEDHLHILEIAYRHKPSHLEVSFTLTNFQGFGVHIPLLEGGFRYRYGDATPHQIGEVIISEVSTDAWYKIAMALHQKGFSDDFLQIDTTTGRVATKSLKLKTSAIRHKTKYLRQSRRNHHAPY